MKFATTLAFATTWSTAASVKLVMVSNTNETPSRAGLYSVDTDAKTGSKIADVDGGFSYVSGAVVCNNHYHAVATDAPIQAGIVTVDIASGKSNPVVVTSYLAQNMWCYNGSDELLAWISSPAPPFTLVTLNATDGTQTSTVAGPFGAGGDGGTDSVFQFDPSIGQAWAEFPNSGNVGGGTLVAVDVKTSNHTSYEIEKGFFPYADWPIATLKEGASYGGLCAYSNEISGKVYFCKNTLVKKKDKVVVQAKVGKDADGAYTEGQPLTPCGGKYYGIFRNSQLFEIDPTTQTLTSVMDLTSAIALKAGQTAGGMACNQ